MRSAAQFNDVLSATAPKDSAAADKTLIVMFHAFTQI